jgi:hypothetical protein
MDLLVERCECSMKLVEPYGTMLGVVIIVVIIIFLVWGGKIRKLVRP